MLHWKRLLRLTSLWYELERNVIPIAVSGAGFFGMLRSLRILQHVLDSSAPILDEHRQSVMEVLRKINVPEEKLQNMIEVLNKVIT